MKKILVLLIVLVTTSSNTYGQKKKLALKGTVTYITSKNAYVKFDNTQLIKVGDSLYLGNSKTPCLLVKNKSSKSVVGIVINNCKIKKGDFIIFKSLKKNKSFDKKPIEKSKTNIIKKEPKIKAYKKQATIKNLEQISGRFSVTSYNNFYKNRDNRQKIISRFSMYANHINNSNFSFETYLNYNKDFNSTYKQSPFKVYDLAGIYNASKSLKIIIGRKVNNNTSSLGAIDGLQIEKHFGNAYAGVIAGFRPDLIDYSFNSNLLQYGAYIGLKTNSENLYSRTTLGAIEQRNNGKIDRRYAYFQHSSTINKSLNLFSSFELDLYNKVNGVTGSNLRLTNFYASARYRFNRYLNTTVSFDSRKRIIYYETYQTEVERLLSNDIARQGLRFRINTRPFKYFSTGVSYSVRFQSDNQNKSDNYSGYISLYRIPNIGGSISVNYNRNTSNYLESNIISFRHSRMLFKNKLSADFYYRLVDYNYLTTNLKLKQNYFGANLSLNISRTLRFSLYGEYLQSNLENNYRINVKLVKRFNNKKKKRNYVY